MKVPFLQSLVLISICRVTFSVDYCDIQVCGRVGYFSHINGDYAFVEVDSNGYPYYQSREDFYIYFIANYQTWNLGPDLASGTVDAYLDESVDSIDQATGNWLVWNGDDFQNDPQVSSICVSTPTNTHGCADDSCWFSEFGNCETYALDEKNHIHCDTDRSSSGVTALDACLMACLVCQPEDDNREPPTGCSDDLAWESTYGHCETYAGGNNNHDYCDSDKGLSPDDRHVSEACPKACKMCEPDEPEDYCDVQMCGREGYLRDMNGHYAFVGVDTDGYPIYRHSEEEFFIYYIQEFETWNLGPELGSGSSVDGYVDEQIASIDLASTNWLIWDGNHYQSDESVETTCTNSNGDPAGCDTSGCDVPNKSWVGDGFCDDSSPGYNTPECEFDGGDCCEETCKGGQSHDCEDTFNYCIDPDIVPPITEEPTEDSAELTEDSTEPTDDSTEPTEDSIESSEDCDVPNYDWIGDGYCDHDQSGYNTPECNYDEGDCCEETCRDGPSHHCEDNMFQYCIDPDVIPEQSDTRQPTAPPALDPIDLRNFEPVCYQTSLTQIDAQTVDLLPSCELLGIIRIQDIDGYSVTVTSTGLPDGAVYILSNGNTISDTSSPLTLGLSRDEPGREGIGIVDLVIQSDPVPECGAQFTVTDVNGDFTTCDYDCAWIATTDCGACTLIGGPCQDPVTRDCICNWIDPTNGNMRFNHCCTGDVWDDICASRAVRCGCERKQHRRTSDISECCFEWSESCWEECEQDFYDECWENGAFCSSRTEESLECQLCCRTNARSQELWNCPFEECQMFSGLPCTHHSRCHFPHDLDDEYFLVDEQVCDKTNCCEQSSRGRRLVWMFEPNSGRCGLLNFTDIVYIDQDSEAVSDWVWGFPQDGDPLGLPADNCPDDPRKFFFGACGCGVVDSDDDRDGVVDCLEPSACRNNPAMFEEPCEAICGDAVIPRSEPETSNSAVEDCVCGIDPICCLLSWDQNCVELAQTDCGCTNYCDLELSGRSGFGSFLNGRYEVIHGDTTNDRPYYINIDSISPNDDDLILYFQDTLSRWAISGQRGGAQNLFARSEVTNVQTPLQATRGTWQVSAQGFKTDQNVKISCVEADCVDDANFLSDFGKCDSYVEGTTNNPFCNDDTDNEGRFASEMCPVACDTCQGDGKDCCFSESFDADIFGYGYRSLSTDTLLDCKLECCKDTDRCGYVQFSESNADGSDFRCTLHAPGVRIEASVYKDYLLYVKTNCGQT